jgi:two-component system, NarL family, sensor histidine kinase DesK
VTVELAVDGGPRLRGARRAILLSVGVIWAGCLVVPVVALLDEPDTARQWLGVVGLLILTFAYAGMLYAAATPSVSERQRRTLGWGFVAASVLSIVLVAPVGREDFYTWAWIGGAAAGFAPLILEGYKRWAAAVAVVVVAVAVGTATGGSPLVHGLIAASLGGTIIATILLPIWLFNLALQARVGREAQAQLAVTEERLRFARDVHDLLGHRLAVIALKAELAARLAGVDPDKAAREAEEVQNLSATALAEVREAVHGYRVVDLDDQLRAVAGVLRDAGIRCTVQLPDVQLPAEAAFHLAFALREGCTNVLRHSTARWCTIEISHDAREVRMTIANDGAGAAVVDRLSSGLHGAAERLGGAGGTLRTRQEGDVFTLDVTVPVS